MRADTEGYVTTEAESAYYLDEKSFPSRFTPQSLGSIAHAYLRHMQENLESNGNLKEQADPRTIRFLCEDYRMASGARDESLDRSTKSLLKVTDKMHTILCQLPDDSDYARNMNQTAGHLMKQVKRISPFMFECK